MMRSVKEKEEEHKRLTKMVEEQKEKLKDCIKKEFIAENKPKKNSNKKTKTTNQP